MRRLAVFDPGARLGLDLEGMGGAWRTRGALCSHMFVQVHLRTTRGLGFHSGKTLMPILKLRRASMQSLVRPVMESQSGL